MTGPVSDRASDPRLVIVGTAGERITQVSPAARAVHAAVLQAFAATGAPPDRLALVRAAGGADLGTAVLTLTFGETRCSVGRADRLDDEGSGAWGSSASASLPGARACR
jgi:hypothetical protein